MEKIRKKILFIFIGGATVIFLVVFYDLLVGNLHYIIFQTFKVNVDYSVQTNNAVRMQAVSFFSNVSSAYGVWFMAVLFTSFSLVKRDWFIGQT